MKYATLLPKDKIENRSYTVDLVVLKEGRGFVQDYSGSLHGIDLKDFILTAADNFIEGKLFKGDLNALKIIKLPVNTSTGDRSFTGDEVYFVTENDTHMQITTDLIGIGQRLFVLRKDEYAGYTIEENSYIMLKQYGGIVNLALKKISKQKDVGFWYDAIIQVYTELKKPEQVKYYKNLKSTFCK